MSQSADGLADTGRWYWFNLGREGWRGGGVQTLQNLNKTNSYALTPLFTNTSFIIFLFFLFIYSIYFSTYILFTAVIRIRDILVRIRFRILLFWSVTSKTPTKIFFFLICSSSYFLYVHLH